MKTHRPYRVLHVVNSLNIGGIETVLLNASSLFNREKYSHQICCLNFRGTYADRFEAIGIPVVVPSRFSRYDPGLPYRIARLIQKEKIDILYARNTTANLWARPGGWLAGVPTIVAGEHGSIWIESPVRRAFQRVNNQFSQLFIANSNAARTMLLNKYNVRHARVRVLYNGIKFSAVAGPNGEGRVLRESLGIPEGHRVIGFVGRLDTQKGLNFLLRAFQDVHRVTPDVHLCVVGDGALRKAAESLCLELGIDASVTFAGFRTDVDALMSIFDIVVVPSIYEPFGNVIVEAAAQAKPIIASNVDGIPEILTDGQSGLLIECTENLDRDFLLQDSPFPSCVVDGKTGRIRSPLGPDVLQMTEAINRCLHDPEWAEALGKSAKESVVSRFSIQRYVRELESIFDSLMDS
jgi:glycosyltransferase involved in cell wall biosynthesis